MDEELRKDIEAVLNLLVRPRLRPHGGDVEALDLDEEGILWVEMQGECSGCPSAEDTLKELLEKEVMSHIPQIKGVEIDSGISDEILAEAMKLMEHRERPGTEGTEP
ncbi:NifU family protein [Caproicibacter sp. BJN0012]|uniref:NifU family protein n=1 Tax=Caproicibacter sp. BJN0012 TaxID=3110227 RepID=UPI002E157224